MSKAADQWTARSTSGRPLTVNALVNMHRMAWAQRTAALREEWGWLWASAGLRGLLLPVIEVDVFPLHLNNRSPQDVAACAPAAKPAIDALVDVRAIRDDGPAVVRRVTFHPPEVLGVDGLEITVHRLTGLDRSA